MANTLVFQGGPLGTPSSGDLSNCTGASGGGLAAWDSGTTYSTGTIVVDRGGMWQATGSNTNSQPISGNTDWTLVGGTPYVELVVGETELTQQPFFSPAMTITGVNQGTKTFTVDGGALGLVATNRIKIITSTGNDGYYTIATATDTVIVVVEAIPDPTVDGFVFGPGYALIPTPGANMLVRPLGVYTVTGAGDAWDDSPELKNNYGDQNGPTAGVNQVPLKLDADFSSTAPFSYLWVDPSGEINQTLPVVNEPIVVYIDAPVSGGTRSARIRMFYDIQSTLVA